MKDNRANEKEVMCMAPAVITAIAFVATKGIIKIAKDNGQEVKQMMRRDPDILIEILRAIIED